MAESAKWPKYGSTRGGIKDLSFEEAVFEGLAPDGGLLVPDFVPDVSAKYKEWASLSFDALAYEITSRFCSPEEIPSADLRDLMKRSYGTFNHQDVVPTVGPFGDIRVMELFHGVSFSFKDVALQGLGNLYEFFLKRKSRRLTIICATSGDTGSAALYGLRGKQNIDCFVLFPEGRVSPIQQKQMTSVPDPNVHCLSVSGGTFDDCQNIVKALFSDLDMKKKYGLGAVNSINWARIMFQITYYFYTYFKLYPKCDGTMSFSVPTGNFGDILAGYYAKRMGLPVRHLVVATNSNDILHRFFTQGKYDMEGVHQTSSPSMDIGISSNFERYLYYLFNSDHAHLKKIMTDFKATGKMHVTPEIVERAGADFASGSASEEKVSEAIKRYFEKYEYVICPHTACGIVAAEEVRDRLKWSTLTNHSVVVLGTAHPGKFSDAVAKACGKPPVLPPALAAAQTAESREIVVKNSEESVRQVIVDHVSVAGASPWLRAQPDPLRCDAIPGEAGMWLVALDVEGTLTPEAWLELQQKTGLEELKRTTAHEPDYDKLMMYRIDVLRRNNIKLQDMKDVVQHMVPLPGCIEFIAWLRSTVPRVLLLTDTFEEYALPIFEKLGYPSVFCNSLTVDGDGTVTGHILRLRDQKRKAVEAFQRLNFRVIAVGDSFNDVSMMKAAEHGIFMHSSAKVEAAYPEFPICRSYDDLKGRILNIVMGASPPRDLVIPAPLEFEAAFRRMWLVVLNVAGTLAPEPWPAMAAVSGISELQTTTDSECNYQKLMETRAQALRKHGVKLQKLFLALQGIEPLPGALDFLRWLKPVVPRSFMITDSFEEYAKPVFNKLGHPSVLCNFLEADHEGYMTKLVTRCADQKMRAVEEFQRLNFRIIAIGHSFNDIPMLKAAEHGILLKPSEQVVAAHPEIQSVSNFEELKEKILTTVKNPGSPKKRKAPEP